MLYFTAKESGENRYQLRLNENSAGFHKQTNGTWQALWSIATKSDLADFVKLSQKASANKITLEAGQNGAADIATESIPGYKFIGLVDAWTDNAYAVTTNRYYAGDNISRVNIRNVGAQSITCSVYVGALYIKMNILY